MKLTINVFDENSVEQALTALDSYRRTFEQRVSTFTNRLATELQDEAQQIFATSVIDDGSEIVDKKVITKYRNANVDVSVKSESGNTVVVIATGEDAVWVEFGTGIYFNGASGGSPHPNGSKLGMVIGGYGKGHGKRKTWGYYEDGVVQLTHGVPAQLPLYRATISVCDRIAEIGREVFESD